MGFFDGLKRNVKISAQMRDEERRMSNLDWDGLKKHLVEVNQFHLEREIYALITLVQMKDTAQLNKLRGTFSDNNFGLALENVFYKMFWLGFTVGSGITDEQFPNEYQELLDGKNESRQENERLLRTKGLDNEFMKQCFSAVRERMFEHGKEHGRRPEFIDFRPRRSYSL